MFKFIAKVWVAGEVNDARRAYKKNRRIRKAKEKEMLRQRGLELQNSNQAEIFAKNMIGAFLSILGGLITTAIFPPLGVGLLIAAVVFIVKAIIAYNRRNK